MKAGQIFHQAALLLRHRLFSGSPAMTITSSDIHPTKTVSNTRLNAHEIAFKDLFERLPEFGLAGYQAVETRTFRGVVIRRAGNVRGLWTYTDGLYRWLPVGCNSEPYATAHEDRALRHMMLLVLKGLLVRRAVRKTVYNAPGTAPEGVRKVA